MIVYNTVVCGFDTVLSLFRSDKKVPVTSGIIATMQVKKSGFPVQLAGELFKKWRMKEGEFYLSVTHQKGELTVKYNSYRYTLRNRKNKFILTKNSVFNLIRDKSPYNLQFINH